MNMALTVGFDTSALEAGFKAHTFRGIGRYVYELKQYFDRCNSDDVHIKSFSHSDFQSKGLLNKMIECLPAGRQTVRQQLVYPWRLGSLAKQGCDILHFPAHMDAPAWSVKNYVLTVLDLIPLVLADLYKANKPGWRFTFARWLEMRAIKNAALVLAISENTARDVHRILGVPEDRIVVTPLGVDERFFAHMTPDDLATVRLRFNLPLKGDIILYVGGIDPRKNYPVLLESYAKVCERAREARREEPLLVLAGEIKSDREYPRLMAKARSLNIEDRIRELGFVTDDELRCLYATSSVFFFPSLYEGFGLPPLEALAAGAPVVSSNTSCLPEVLGDAAILIDPTKSEVAADALWQVITTPKLSRDLIECGKVRAAKFTWKNTGDKTLAAYHRLMNSSHLH